MNLFGVLGSMKDIEHNVQEELDYYQKLAQNELLIQYEKEKKYLKFQVAKAYDELYCKYDTHLFVYIYIYIYLWARIQQIKIILTMSPKLCESNNKFASI